MFRVSQHPSSGVLKTVTAVSGTGHNTGTATSLQRGLIGTPFDVLIVVYIFRLFGITNFSAHGSVRRNSMLIKIQPDATVSRYLFTAKYYDLCRRLRLQFLVHLMMGAVTPETCRATLQ